LKIYASRGSVVTQIQCGGTLNNYFIANCLQYASMKEF